MNKTTKDWLSRASVITFFSMGLCVGSGITPKELAHGLYHLAEQKLNDLTTVDSKYTASDLEKIVSINFPKKDIIHIAPNSNLGGMVQTDTVYFTSSYGDFTAYHSIEQLTEVFEDGKNKTDLTIHTSIPYLEVTTNGSSGELPIHIQNTWNYNHVVNQSAGCIGVNMKELEASKIKDIIIDCSKVDSSIVDSIKEVDDEINSWFYTEISAFSTCSIPPQQTEESRFYLPLFSDNIDVTPTNLEYEPWLNSLKQFQRISRSGISDELRLFFDQYDNQIQSGFTNSIVAMNPIFKETKDGTPYVRYDLESTSSGLAGHMEISEDVFIIGLSMGAIEVISNYPYASNINIFDIVLKRDVHGVTNEQLKSMLEESSTKINEHYENVAIFQEVDDACELTTPLYGGTTYGLENGSEVIFWRPHYTHEFSTVPGYTQRISIGSQGVD